MTSRALQAAIYLANSLLGISILTMFLGLALGARPELFAGFGDSASTRTGLAIALAGGFGAIFSALLGRLLELIAGSVGNGDNA